MIKIYIYDVGSKKKYFNMKSLSKRLDRILAGAIFFGDFASPLQQKKEKKLLEDNISSQKLLNQKKYKN